MNTPNNAEIIRILTLIADLLDIKGEVIFKILAYRKAAESLAALGQEAESVWKAGGQAALRDIQGVGQAIAEKIEELLITGRLGFLEKLTQEIPESLAGLLQVPDLGPKKIRLFWQSLGITTLDELEAAGQAGKLRSLPGMGEKSEAKILAGIAALKRSGGRLPLDFAWEFAQHQIAFLRSLPGVTAAEAAGSLRRMRETVGDIDLLAAAANPAPVLAAFTSQPNVLRVTGQGNTKASVEFMASSAHTPGVARPVRAQLWVHPPERFGTALQYATGSKDHNVRLRELALEAGYSLSEHALTPTDGPEILCATEEALYQRLGLAWIPPELREDRGEVQAAQRPGGLPVLIKTSEIVSQLHNHTTWSDGRCSIEEMALAALSRGYSLLAITDHTYSLGLVGGVNEAALEKQRIELDAVQTRMGHSIKLLLGVELEIRADGSLDFPDEVLAGLDIVVASLHVSLRQPREKVTERLLNAIRNPHVDIIGHPSGRLLPDAAGQNIREGADLEMEAILQAAREHDVALEINANPARLDLNDAYARRAAEMGIKITINADAHTPEHFDYLPYGVAVARRAWLRPSQVINTWEPEKVLDWLRRRG